ncbi:MAG: hypothetical protein C5B51_15360 [Terriglobia bacterium]|nr:MAG: hypothetical protein C5B51_15360 [Terriglobia bacterium]
MYPMIGTREISNALTVLWTLAVLAAAERPDIRQLKDVEQSAGFRPTRNFVRTDPRVTAYYRCYYTGKLELPESYDDLKLRQGTSNGCVLDERKYDVFFYPIEAVASGRSPVTRSLATASADRLVMVVPHEDFHAQIDCLPPRIAEAAATLMGFVTGAAALDQPSLDADLFLRKAEIVNRTFDHLSKIYQTARNGGISEREARKEQQGLLDGFQQECATIAPRPRFFNQCLSAANNAGLAFDHTYTKFYPLLYNVYRGCGKDLKCTAQKILRAPRNTSEPAVLAYFERF